jgi:hypothetical protein
MPHFWFFLKLFIAPQKNGEQLFAPFFKTTFETLVGATAVLQEPILRLLNLQLQRQRCSVLERFFQSRRKYFISKRTRLLVALSMTKSLAL